MKNIFSCKLRIGFAVLVAVMILVCIGCKDPAVSEKEEENNQEIPHIPETPETPQVPQTPEIPVTPQVPQTIAVFSKLAANGSVTETTDKLFITFDRDIENLDMSDIFLISGNGASKDTLTKLDGIGKYELSVSDITETETVMVAVIKDGYRFIPESREIGVNYYFPPVDIEFSGLAADGTTGVTTSKLILTFDKDIPGFNADNITLTTNTGAKKEALTKIDTGIYELLLTGITSDGSVTVEVSKTGYIFTPASMDADVVYYYVPPEPVEVSFNSLTADGSATTTTTIKLTLTFDKDIPDFETNDITLTTYTGATKGTLTKLEGMGIYELTLTGILLSGSVTIEVNKTDYIFTPNTKEADIYYVVPVAFNNLTADGSPSETTTKLTLTFSNEIINLTGSDITLTSSTGAAKGILVNQGAGIYELVLNDITTSGSVTITVNKNGYGINPASREVYVFNEYDTGEEGFGKIDIIMWVDEEDIAILSSANNFTISRTGANSVPQSFTATVNGGYTNIEWDLFGAPLGHSGDSLTINALDYGTGNYKLGVKVYKDLVPYSIQINFTVTE